MTAVIQDTAQDTARRDLADPGVRSRPVPSTRRLIGLLLIALLLALLMLLSTSVGSKDIPFSTVLRALFESSGQGDDYVVHSLRIPRTLLGIAVGAALGVAGSLIQALTRNPLADPGILGVNAGASLFVVIGIAFFGATSINQNMWFAFVGALLTTVLVYVVGSAGRGSVDPVRLTLAGVAVGAVLTGIVTVIILTDPLSFDVMRGWSAGSIAGRGADVLVPVLPYLVIGLLIALLSARSLNAIALGDDLARSMGANVMRTRVLVIIAVTLLAGGATAIAGPIGFVGLMIPHIARWITGPDQRWIISYSLILAPALVLASDVLGRIVLRSGELPVGIVTAFVGAPVLIFLVRRRTASGI